MARLKSQVDSDDDLPDLATLLRRPAEQRSKVKSSFLPPPRTPKEASSTATQSSNAKPKSKNPASLVPKIKKAETQGRPQRALHTFNNTSSFPSPFASKFTESACAKEVAEKTTNSTGGIVRATPRRTAKKPVNYRPVTPSSPAELDEEDNETTWCKDESEEENGDTVVEDDFWGEELKQSSPKAWNVVSTKLGKKVNGSGFVKAEGSIQDTQLHKHLLVGPVQDVPMLKDVCPEFPVSEGSRPSSSYSADNNAILSFDPPPRSPRKLELLIRPTTPSPPSSPSKGRLASPSKSIKRIPTPPHKQSADRFWDQSETNTWNEQHSPRKILASPRKKKFLEDLFADDGDEGEKSPTESPKKRSPVKGSPVKQSKQQKEAKRYFEAKKRDIARSFIQELDERITNGKIAELTQETGGVEIMWNKKLNSTAGRAHWKRESVKIDRVEADGKQWRARHRAHIELAEKVIDDEDRLLNVLAHEFCHLANFMISEVKDNPHGKEFKSWAAKVSSAFHRRNIKVTTKHSYDISYKYIWECVSCGHEYKRHSKSIDPTKQGCGACRSSLVQTKPAIRAGAKPSDYQLFIKQNFQRAKRDNPGLALGGLMEILGREYREQKAETVRPENAATGVDDLVKELEIITLDE